MPTDFPTSVDAFDDPAGGAPTNAGPRTLSQRLRDHNDAIEAIESFVLERQTATAKLHVNARDFGVLGAGADYTAELQAALDEAAPGAGGPGVVRVFGHVKAEQIVIPAGVMLEGTNWGGFGKAFGGTYAGNHNATMLEQVAGVNDDFLVFETEPFWETSGSYPDGGYVGPCGITDMVLQGDAASTAGSGICLRQENGYPLLSSEGVWFKRLYIAGFAEHGIEFPIGTCPMHFEDIDAYFNGGFGISVVRLGNGQSLYFEHISGDGNEALIRCKNFTAADAITFVSVKSEKIPNPFRVSAHKQENAIVLEDCQDTAVTINGMTHISAASNGLGGYEAPGAAIKIVASTAGKVPRLRWAGVAVRIHPSGETGGPGPILEDATNAVTVANGVAFGEYVAGIAGAPETVPVGSFTPNTGSPVLGSVGGGRRQAYLFDAAVDEIIMGQWMVPPGWRSMRFVLLWVNAAGGAGVVQWIVQGHQFTEGQTLNVADSLLWGVGNTAGAQDVLVDSPTNAQNVVGGRMLELRIKRSAVDVGDTLPNDAALVGLLAERIS